MRALRPWPGIAGFLFGLLPLLALAFFSPGLGSEGLLGMAALAWGLATLALLVAAALGRPVLWALVLAQALLVAAVLYETWPGAALYIGT